MIKTKEESLLQFLRKNFDKALNSNSEESSQRSKSSKNYDE